MKLKGKIKLELARELARANTKGLSVADFMRMSKKDFLEWWKKYCLHCEAEERMGY